jgi:hypothetical protein
VAADLGLEEALQPEFLLKAAQAFS